jgi:hypothetical protein
MKHVSERGVREAASTGKNKPMARSSKVVPQQNAETGPPIPPRALNGELTNQKDGNDCG